MIDLSFEQLLSDDEILSGLAISQEELSSLEDHGLIFIQIGDSHFYLSSTLLTFLKGIEGKTERRGRRKRKEDGDKSILDSKGSGGVSEAQSADNLPASEEKERNSCS